MSCLAMQHLIIRLIITLLAFIIGVTAHMICVKYLVPILNNRDHIIDTCTELILSYED